MMTRILIGDKFEIIDYEYDWKFGSGATSIFLVLGENMFKQGNKVLTI